MFFLKAVVLYILCAPEFFGEVSEKMVQCLKVLPTLEEDPGFVPAYMAADNHL